MWKKNAGMISKKDQSKSFPSGTRIKKIKPKRDPAGNPRIGIPPLIKKVKKTAEDEEPCEDDEQSVQEEEKEHSPEVTTDDRNIRRLSNNSLNDVIDSV